MKTNVTIRIDETLAHEAKVLAARRGTSLSRFLAEALEQIVNRDQAYEKSMNQALKDMKNAPVLGLRNIPSRDELHEH